MKKITIILIIHLLIISCAQEEYQSGFFTNTEKINIRLNSNSSLVWDTSYRDAEVILIITTQNIQLSGSSIISSNFNTSNTAYWRLSFGRGQNGSININSDLSNSISSYVATTLSTGLTWNWLVYSYDKNGNLIRSSLVYSFTN